MIIAYNFIGNTFQVTIKSSKLPIYMSWINYYLDKKTIPVTINNIVVIMDEYDVLKNKFPTLLDPTIKGRPVEEFKTYMDLIIAIYG